MLDDAIQVVDVVKVKDPRSAMYTVGMPDDIPSGVPTLKNTIESMTRDLKTVNNLSNREDSMFVHVHGD